MMMEDSSSSYLIETNTLENRKKQNKTTQFIAANAASFSRDRVYWVDFVALSKASS